VGQAGLVYLSLADLQRHGLSEADLLTLTSGDASPALLQRWRSLVRELCARARVMRATGAGMARSTWESLPRDCEFIFRLIVGMYAELLDRIEADPDSILEDRPILDDADKAAILTASAAATGFAIPEEFASTP
jgi:phytoene/squalene synthetase